MEVQYSEGMPCVVMDREKGRMYFDTANDYSEAFAAFYEAYLAATEAKAGAGDFSSHGHQPGLLERHLRAGEPAEGGRERSGLT